MGYGNFCTCPAHILGLPHPRHTPDATNVSFRTAFGRDDMHFPVMGAWVVVVRNTPQLAPTGTQSSIFHRAGPDGTMNLLPLGEELVTIIYRFILSDDPAERVQLMKDDQRICTENVHGVGLTQHSAALIVKRRCASPPTGIPGFMFNRGEDSIKRERMDVPPDRKQGHERHPGTHPGTHPRAPGSRGPV
jgi:peptide/nickel transport system substrate-binding protein